MLEYDPALDKGDWGTCGPAWNECRLEESESEGASMLTSGGLRTSGMGCAAWCDLKREQGVTWQHRVASQIHDF